MINEITNAALLLGTLLLIVFGFVDYYVLDSERNCKHKNWAQYHSKKCRVCIDCGKVEPFEAHI